MKVDRVSRQHKNMVPYIKNTNKKQNERKCRTTNKKETRQKTVFPVETEKKIATAVKKNSGIRFRANFARAAFYSPRFCEC